MHRLFIKQTRLFLSGLHSSRSKADKFIYEGAVIFAGTIVLERIPSYDNKI